MLGIIKRTKLVYAVYNFFHRNQLSHNETVFRKLGLKKKYYSSLSSKDFAGMPGPVPETTLTDQQKLVHCSLYNKLSPTDKESLSSFADNGYAIIRNYLSDEQADQINAEIESLLHTKKLQFKFGKKIMFAIHVSRLLWDIGNDPQLLEVLSVLVGGKATLFSSINFLMGSEQETHSDSIHMTTYPLGGLLGVWFALEDITEENGPLHYFPGSHKLPYYLNSDYDNEGNRLFLGEKTYGDYEAMISKKIGEQKMEKVKFFARKGDMLIWHANLFHGGDPHHNKQKTRKSMVFHYFREESICYHEITQRPALFKRYR